MVTTLRSLLARREASVDPEDVYALFVRRARGRWGERMTLKPRRLSRGILTVECGSPLWRTELVFHADELLTELLSDLPGSRLSRIAAVLR